MPEFVERVSKRKGIAWRKSGLYVHPPEPDQWDNFLPKDSNRNNDNDNNKNDNTDEATFEVTTILPASAQTETTESAMKPSLLSCLAKRVTGTAVPQTQKSRRRRRQSGTIASVSEHITSEESASTSNTLPTPPIFPRQQEVQEEAVALAETTHVTQSEDTRQVLSNQNSGTTNDRLASSGDNSHSENRTPPLTPHGNRSCATDSSPVQPWQGHDTPFSQEESHGEKKEASDGCKPLASNDFSDDNSPVGVDQFVHRPSNGILRPKESLRTSSSHDNSAHQPLSESTTSLVQDEHQRQRAVRDNKVCCENRVEISSDLKLPCKDVYVVLRRLERKTKRQRTIPQPACDSKFYHDKASDLMTIEEGARPLSSQSKTIVNIEGRVPHGMVQPNSRPPSHSETSREKISIVRVSKSTSFQVAFQDALQKLGFLDQYVFVEQCEHLSNILVRDESNINVPLGTCCGDDRFWRMVAPTSLEYSLSETLETNQLRWEAALLQYVKQRHNEIRFPEPVDICLYRNKVALRLKLQTGSSVLGTLLQVITLHSTFGMGAIPEPVIGWLVLEMIKIMASLHRIGIAHNHLGLESFLVAFDGAEWNLLLIGLGRKSSVQVGDDLKIHFHHDMLSVAFITWSLLMGCAPFQFSHVNGEIKVEGLQNIAMNMYLRGRLEWNDLFTALANSAAGSQGIGSVPETTVSGDSIAGFFDALLALGPNVLNESASCAARFPTTLGISSEELVFKLHFAQSVSYTSIDNPEALSKVSNEGQSNNVRVNQCSTVQGTSLEKHPPFEMTSDFNECRKRDSKSNVPSPNSHVDDGAPPTVPPASKYEGTQRASTTFEVRSCKGPLGSTDRVVTFVPARPRFDSSRSPRRSMKELLTTKTCRRSSRTVPMCGMNGCKNQFPVNNGYMWVMMVGLEEQTRLKSESVIPIHLPMHLVCLKCREPNADLMFPAQELFDDPREKRRWENHLYYKASKVEYDKIIGKGKKA